MDKKQVLETIQKRLEDWPKDVSNFAKCYAAILELTEELSKSLPNASAIALKIAAKVYGKEALEKAFAAQKAEFDGLFKATTLNKTDEDAILKATLDKQNGLIEFAENYEELLKK